MNTQTQPKTTKAIAHLLSLPLSQQIREFVADARKVFALPNFREKMSTFGQRSKNDPEVCLTCIGGAALANRDKRAFKRMLNTGLRPDGDTMKAAILGDDIRTGALRGWIGYYRDLTKAQDEAVCAAQRVIREKCFGPRGRAPWRTYLQAANILEAAGL